MGEVCVVTMSRLSLGLVLNRHSFFFSLQKNLGKEEEKWLFLVLPYLDATLILTINQFENKKKRLGTSLAFTGIVCGLNSTVYKRIFTFYIP